MIVTSGIPALLSKLRSKAASGAPLVAGDSKDADLVLAYGFPTPQSPAALLPLGDANDLILRRAPEVIPEAGGRLVLAGVCGTDPMRLMGKFLEQVRDAGYSGVHNFPTVGAIDGAFRGNVESTSLGYEREVEMIREAGGMGLATAAHAFTPGEAVQMAEARADILIVHGSAEIAAAARRARTDILILGSDAAVGRSPEMQGYVKPAGRGRL